MKMVDRNDDLVLQMIWELLDSVAERSDKLNPDEPTLLLNETAAKGESMNDVKMNQCSSLWI